MAIGTPVALGTATSSTTVTSKALVTAANANAGEAIIVFISASTSATAFALTDTAGNTYTLSNIYAGSAGKVFIGYCLNPAALTAGDTITLSWTTASRVAMSAVQISGLQTTAALDKDPSTGSAGTGTTFTQATGALAQADEIILGAFTTDNTSGVVVSPGTGFTALAVVTVPSGNQDMHPVYKIVASTTDTNFNPSWTTSRAFTGNLWSFKAAAAAASARASLALLGVG